MTIRDVLETISASFVAKCSWLFASRTAAKEKSMVSRRFASLPFARGLLLFPVCPGQRFDRPLPAGIPGIIVEKHRQKGFSVTRE
ncbi:hypothetical protein ACFL0Q_07420 [Thermodesulfobacteriota bacterium]